MQEQQLLAPAEYWNATPEQIERICNGAGPWGIGSVLFMKILGIDMSEPCGIHDWMYTFGRTAEYKKVADDTFLHNMNLLIEIADRDIPQGMKWVTRARRRQAFRYYTLVVNFGGISFGGGEK